ncbi:MAG: hypothetical protein M5U30_18075 [Burkholderiaceae bacterium]|nr:hypothetical protein [Burkholderiaceae bacterium]
MVFQVVQGHAFGDLETDFPCRFGVRPDQRDRVLQELLVVQRCAAQVQGAEVDVVAVAGLRVEPFERAAQHPAVDLGHQAVALRSRNEACRRKNLAAGVAHPDQSLVAERRLRIAQRDDRLQLHEEALDRQALLHARDELDLVEIFDQCGTGCVIGDDGRASRCLRLAARPVARGERIGRAHVLEDPDHADARRDVEGLVLVLVRTVAQFAAQLLAQGAGGLERQPVHDDHQFVAANARRQVRRPDHFAHAGRHLAQDLVAGGVPEQVVHQLEAVEVDVGQAHGTIPRGADGLQQVQFEAAPVQQPGQRIVVDQELELAFSVLARGDVLDPPFVPVGLAHRPDVDPAPLAVGSNDRELGIHHPVAGRRLLDRLQGFGTGEFDPARPDLRMITPDVLEHLGESRVVLDDDSVGLHRKDADGHRVVVLAEALEGADGAVLGGDAGCSFELKLRGESDPNQHRSGYCRDLTVHHFGERAWIPKRVDDFPKHAEPCHEPRTGRTRRQLATHLGAGS